MLTPISFKKNPSQVDDPHLSNTFIMPLFGCLLRGDRQLCNLLFKLYRLPGCVDRDKFIELLRSEKPETCHWVGLDAITRHFAGLINGDNMVALQAVLGRH